MTEEYSHDSYNDTFIKAAGRSQLSSIKRSEWIQFAKSFAISCIGLGLFCLLLGFAIYFARKEKVVERVQTVTREIVREVPIIQTVPLDQPARESLDEISSSDSTNRSETAGTEEEIVSQISELLQANSQIQDESSADERNAEDYLPNEFVTFTTMPFDWSNPTGTGNSELVVGKSYNIGEESPNNQWCYIIQSSDGVVSSRLDILSSDREISYGSATILTEREFDQAKGRCLAEFNAP